MAFITMVLEATLEINDDEFEPEYGNDGASVVAIIRKSDRHRFQPQLLIEHQLRNEEPLPDLTSDSEMAEEGFRYLEYNEKRIEM